MLPKEDRSYATRGELMDKLKTLLAGRVAEEVVLKEISTGAQNDIQRASQIVRSMITQYGMSDVLGPIAFGEGQDHQVFLGRDINHQRNYSEEVASDIDKEVRKYMEDAYEACRTLLTENVDKLHLIAKALVERETLEASELEELMTKGFITDKEETPEKPDEKKDDGAVIMQPLETTETVEAPAAVEQPAEEKPVQKEAEPKLNITRHE